MNQFCLFIFKFQLLAISVNIKYSFIVLPFSNSLFSVFLFTNYFLRFTLFPFFGKC